MISERNLGIRTFVRYIIISINSINCCPCIRESDICIAQCLRKTKNIYVIILSHLTGKFLHSFGEILKRKLISVTRHRRVSLKLYLFILISTIILTKHFLTCYSAIKVNDRVLLRRQVSHK